MLDWLDEEALEAQRIEAKQRYDALTPEQRAQEDMLAEILQKEIDREFLEQAVIDMDAAYKRLLIKEEPKNE